MKKTIWIIFSLVMASAQAFATTGNTRQLDSIKNTSGGSSLSIPSTGTTLATDTNTLTLSSKTISGSSNTLSNLPIANQYAQDTFSGNGSATTFTLSNTIPAAIGVVVYLDGRALIQGSSFDYTVSGTTLTMSTAPATGQRILAVYSKY